MPQRCTPSPASQAVKDRSRRVKNVAANALRSISRRTVSETDANFTSILTMSHFVRWAIVAHPIVNGGKAIDTSYLVTEIVLLSLAWVWLVSPSSRRFFDLDLRRDLMARSGYDEAT